MLAVAGALLILLALLFPVLQSGPSRAQGVRCLSNLKMLQQAHQLYLSDNRQQLIPYYGSILWMSMVLPYHVSGSDVKKDRLRFCPSATAYTASNPASCAWYYPDGSWGSYGMNGYMYSISWAQDMPDNDWLLGGRYHPRLDADQLKKKWFGSVARVSANTPLFMDCQWVDVWPREDLSLPDTRVNTSISGLVDPDSAGSLVRVSLTRHGRAVGMVFVDGHAELVPLQRLKTLKWSLDWQNGN